MKLLLLVVDDFKEYKLNHYPTGLRRLSSYLNKKGIKVDVVHCDLGVKFNKLGKDEKSEVWEGIPEPVKNYDAIGISMTTFKLVMPKHESTDGVQKPTRFGFFVKRLRKETDVPFIIGGPGGFEHRYEFLGRFEDIDFLVYQYGETPLIFLLNKIKKLRLKHPITTRQFEEIKKGICSGIYLKYYVGKRGVKSFTYEDRGYKFYNSPGFRFPPKTKTLKDPSQASEEKYELPKSLKKLSKSDIYSIETSFGCPYGKCTFCEWGRISKYLQRDMNEVLNEIKDSQRGIIHIADACFLSEGVTSRSANMLWKLLKKMVAGEINHPLTISMEARVAGFPKDESEMKKLLKLLRICCHRIHIGYESGSDKILREFNKGNTVEEAKRVTKLLSKKGIPIEGYFILTSPSSNMLDIAKTIEFMTYLCKISDRNGLDYNGSVIADVKAPLCRQSRVLERYITEYGRPVEYEVAKKRNLPEDPLAREFAVYASVFGEAYGREETDKGIKLSESNGISLKKIRHTIIYLDDVIKLFKRVVYIGNFMGYDLTPEQRKIVNQIMRDKGTEGIKKKVLKDKRIKIENGQVRVMHKGEKLFMETYPIWKEYIVKRRYELGEIQETEKILKRVIKKMKFEEYLKYPNRVSKKLKAYE